MSTKLLAIITNLFVLCLPCIAIDHWTETGHILTGVEIVSVDADMILVGKDSKPAVQPCGIIFVSEAGQVRVEAENKDRDRLKVTQRTTSEDQPRQWVIHATGQVWVRIELIDFETQRWDVERFDFVIEGKEPDDDGDDDDGPQPPEPTDVPNEYGVGLVAFNAVPNDPATTQKLVEVYRAAGEFLFGRPSLKFITSSDDPKNNDPNRSVLAWIEQQRNAASPSKDWDVWADRVKQAMVYSQGRRQYTKTDWYNVFNEVADALEMVK